MATTIINFEELENKMIDLTGSRTLDPNSILLLKIIDKLDKIIKLL